MGNDPRPLFDQAHAWCLGTIRTLDESDLARPTPCAEWDVRTVIAHLIAAIRRAAHVGRGGAPMDVPLVAEDIADSALIDQYLTALEDARQVWSDDTLLDREVLTPWGPTPGRAAIGGWVQEPLVHGWDIAVATGRPVEAPADIAEPVLALAAAFLPSDARQDTPFGAPVPSRHEAGPTERLANWCGHGWTA